MDELQELLARLNEPGDNPLSDDELADLDQRLRARAAELAEDDSDDALEELRGIAEARTQIDTETQTRTEAAEARQRERDELLGRINGNGEGEGDEGSEGDGDGDEGSGAEGDEGSEGSEGTPAGDTGDGSGTGEGEPGTGAETPEAQAASASRRRNIRPPISEAARRGSARHAPRPEPETRPQATIVAASGAPQARMGEELTLDGLRQQVERAWQLQAGSRARKVDGLKTVVATVRQPIEDSQRLTEQDATGNSQRIEALAAAARNLSQSAITAAGGSVNRAAAEAITAAGGTCAPIPSTYDLGDNISSAERPLRDADVTLPAPRGGVRRLLAPQLADVDGMAYVWSYANDLNPNFADTDGPDVPVDERLATKPCIRIECPDEDTIMADAIPLCLRTGNFNRMTFPELFARWWELGQAAHARLAENKHFAKQVDDATSTYSATQMLGASIDVLTAIDRIIAARRYQYRMGENMPIRFKAPAWVRDMIRTDRTRRGRDNDDLTLSNEQINAWFTARNVNPTWLPDANQPIGLEDSDDPQFWPDDFQAVIHHEGAWAHIDAGELDFGTEIRDSTLIAVNDVQAFMETFEQTFFIGVWSDAVTFDVCPDGTASAPVELVGACTPGS